MEKKSSRDGKKTTPPKPGTPESTNWTRLWWYLPLALLMLWMWQDILFQAAVKTISYSQFKQHVAAREVKQCEIHDAEIVGEIVPAKSVPPAGDAGEQAPSTPDAESPQQAVQKSPETPVGGGPSSAPGDPQAPGVFRFRTVRVEDPELIKQLDDNAIEYVAVRPGLLSNFIFAWLLPMGMIVGFWLLMSRRLGSPGQAVMSIGKSRATLVGDKDTGVAFDDVAGCDEAKAELQEVVDFLKNPERYAGLGAKIPKGVLLVGPPGTGKTLLARAVAGEAKVPFFSLSGSDFVEMFVGVGASRVRDLFNQAVAQAPCIVFIDELDAIGRERGVHVGAVNDEREQTLNQLLVEMDGFEPNSGVILLAATNRPEVLDRALLRPGRFDRQVVVDAPDLEGRVAILHVHCRQKPLAEDVDLQKIARGTPGFSGADLANIANEAALLAARRSSNVIKQADFEEAIEKVVAGPERKSRRLEEDEKRRVAYHEVGHALVGAFSKHADPVHKISIVPRGRAALGYTLHLPAGQTFLQTRSELIDKIKVLLGGRAAEEIVYGEVSTGAENDLERATDIARQMVCMFGMSTSVGLIHCARRQSLFLSPDGGGRLDCSDATAEKADLEVQELLQEAYGNARKLLEERRELLESVSAQLFEHETIDGAAFYLLVQPSP